MASNNPNFTGTDKVDSPAPASNFTMAIPPPSYDSLEPRQHMTSPNQYSTDSTKHHPPPDASPSTTTLPDYHNTPPQSHPRSNPPPAQAGEIPPAALLHIYSTGGVFSKRQLDITIEDKQTVAWHVTFPRSLPFSSKPHVQLQRGPGGGGGPVVGTATFHSWGGATALFLANATRAGQRETELRRDGHFTARHRVVLDGRAYFWKHTRQDVSFVSSGNLKCVDGEGRVYATFSSTEHKSVRKVGRLAVWVEGLGDGLVEGIVLSCMALHEKERRERRRSSGVAAAGAAGGGGG